MRRTDTQIRVKCSLGMLPVTMAACALLAGMTAFVPAGGAEEPCFFKSLHHTGEGMRYWYEAPGGFMDITGIPYKDLDCKNCHVESCDPCHAAKKDGACLYTSETAKDMETCLKCHSRERLTMTFGKQRNAPDVHFSKGMVCADCHKSKDVHGDGQVYASMRAPGAVGASCGSCHETGDDIRAHTVHKGKLECSACHVENTTACLNCHFDGFLATGSRKGKFIPLQKWMLLINHEGKVTSGAAMSMVYKDRKFILYAPYFSHAIQAKGKDCASCHANAAMELIADGKPVPMLQFINGKSVHWEGVAPTVPDKLSWVFLNKVDEKWEPIEDAGETKVQFVGYGDPLTEGQIKKLSMPMK
jgi:hypothetical protein